MNANVAGQPSARPALDRRLEGIGWALFLIMIGGIGLIQNVPQGTWLVGTGLIMLSLNFVRYVNGIPMRHFTLVLGILALLLGIGGMTGVDVPFFPILLIIIGADILFKIAARNRQSEQRTEPAESGREIENLVASSSPSQVPESLATKLSTECWSLKRIAIEPHVDAASRPSLSFGSLNHVDRCAPSRAIAHQRCSSPVWSSYATLPLLSARARHAG